MHLCPSGSSPHFWGFGEVSQVSATQHTLWEFCTDVLNCLSAVTHLIHSRSVMNSCLEHPLDFSPPPPARWWFLKYIAKLLFDHYVPLLTCHLPGCVQFQKTQLDPLLDASEIFFAAWQFLQISWKSEMFCKWRIAVMLGVEARTLHMLQMQRNEEDAFEMIFLLYSAENSGNNFIHSLI